MAQKKGLKEWFRKKVVAIKRKKAAPAVVEAAETAETEASTETTEADKQ